MFFYIDYLTTAEHRGLCH